MGEGERKRQIGLRLQFEVVWLGQAFFIRPEGGEGVSW